MFEVVGVDPPIKVSLTSGAGVTGVFSDIEGANGVVMFVLFNNIVSDGISSCANIGLLIILSCCDIATYERDIPARSVDNNTIVLILMLDLNTYTNDLRLTFSWTSKLSQKNFWICFLMIMLVFVHLSSSEIISCKECGQH
jgi:hypothetical protein